MLILVLRESVIKISGSGSIHTPVIAYSKRFAEHAKPQARQSNVTPYGLGEDCRTMLAMTQFSLRAKGAAIFCYNVQLQLLAIGQRRKLLLLIIRITESGIDHHQTLNIMTHIQFVGNTHSAV